MSVFVKVTQELLTQEQCVQVFNNELGGVQLRLIENFSENSFIMYLTSAEAKALARMLNEVADK
jgi:Mg/Co/Ni transporter MgtE